MIEPKEFLVAIEEYVESTGESYVDAVLWFQVKHGLEVETVGSLVRKNPSLKLKMMDEGIANKTVKGDNKPKLEF